jgi:hypothetical protein
MAVFAKGYNRPKTLLTGTQIGQYLLRLTVEVRGEEPTGLPLDNPGTAPSLATKSIE